MTDEINWEEELSLGEKQRLAMARLLYQKPKFAILDECTSGVSGEMEKRLFELCQEHEITYITISHRPVLQASDGYPR
jgi:ATP-binding cassette subfamily D (ALD) protein 3